MLIRRLLSALSLFALVACTGHADEASVRKEVESRLENIQIKSLKKAPLGGLYEIVTENEIFYTDEGVTFFMVGNLIEAKTLKNLTEERIADLRRVRFDRLPLDQAIKTVKGNGARKLAVFSDPDCPFCVRLEKELQKVDNVTVYTFLFPLKPGADVKAKAVWCSKDPSRAWDELMLKGVVPKGDKSCPNPIEKNLELGGRLRLNGTPALLFSDGRVVPGAISAEKLEAYLSAAEEAGKAK